jgi:hypothetical protein
MVEDARHHAGSAHSVGDGYSATTAPKTSDAAEATPVRAFPTVKFDTLRLATTVSAGLRRPLRGA